ncbi:MAG TPA: helix-hairpin-helix domain-containing protein [Terracidiphilus sp.]|jgi:DNA uptake protein ComE-like DNA-binding protein
MRNVSLRIRFVFIAAGFLALVPPLVSVALVHPLHTGPSVQTSPPSEDRVDINSATIRQLMKVPGMTRTWAARIIRFRPYRAKNDLLERGIVTSQVYDRIKDYIIAHRVKQ